MKKLQSFRVEGDIDCQILEVAFCLIGMNMGPQLFLWSLFLDILVAYSEHAHGQVMTLLVPIEANCELGFLEGLHEEGMVAETDFLGVRFEDGDVERVEGEIGDGDDAVHVAWEGEVELLWGSDLDDIHLD